MRVLVFGESSVQGFWDSQGGWVARLQRYYDERQVKDLSKELPRVMNLGISGANTQAMLDRFDNETKARQNPKGVSFVISTGGNSSMKEGDSYVSTPEIYEGQIKVLIDKAKQYSDKIMFVGLCPFDDSKTNPVPWGEYYFTNERRKMFDDITAKACKQEDVPFVQVFEKFGNKLHEDILAHDAMHPNDKGHQLIFELVRSELDRLLEAKA